MEVIKSYQNKNKCVILKLGLHFSQEKNLVEGEVELDIENQAKLVDVLNAVFAEDLGIILVDLSLVSYIDSSGLWALFEGHKKAAQKKAFFCLISPTFDVKRVLDITKVSSKMKIFNSCDQALSELV